MKLRFSIHYRTEWGQNIVILLRYIDSSGSERSARLPMLTQDGETWTAETAVLESRRSSVEWFSYLYIVEDAEGNELRREWNGIERSYPFDASRTLLLADVWRDLPLNEHLYSSAYQVTALPTSINGDRQTRKDTTPPYIAKLPYYRKTVLFRVSAPQLLPHQQLAVIGSHPALGSWNPTRYLAMERAGKADWMLTLNVDWLALPLEYKYVVVDSDNHELTAWEEGDNRIIDGNLNDGEVFVAYGEPLRLKEKAWRIAGVSIPVFALRSENSCGVGDFGDLLLLIDWAQEVGLRVIQLLPLNDTTTTGQWGDSDPYNIVSSFKIHPHYIDLNQLGALKDKDRMTSFRRQQQELNSLSYSDYEAVDRVKMEYLKEFYEELANKNTYSSFDDFVQQNLHLQLKRVAEYARQKGVILMGDMPIGMSSKATDVKEHPELFCTDCYTGTPPDSQSYEGQNWGLLSYDWKANGLADYMKRRLQWMEQYFDALRIDHTPGYFRIWQIPSEQVYAAMGQFSPALPLTSGEIELAGLPFRHDFLTKPFINDKIVDRIFGIHAQFVRDTFLKRKGYGLYNLKEEVATQKLVYQHFKDSNDENSIWIRDGLCRLVANVLFLKDMHHDEMYHPRIQAWHEPVFGILSDEEKEAFMRIYNNFFYQRHSMLWGATGYKRLGLLQNSTDMLLCAENLGLQPDCVEPVLDSLRILTLEIQRMPRQTGLEYAHLDANPVRSVAMASTHDMAPLRLWWQENAAQAQRFYTTMLQKQGRAPEQLSVVLAEEIIARHLYSPSMICILQLQDWLAMDGELRSKNLREERINTPGDAYNRWQWRMHINIEKLIKAERFNKKIQRMIKLSKRNDS